MANETVTLSTLGPDARRAVDSLLQIAQRMAWLATASEVTREKLSGELAGMGPWVSAFALHLAGLPLQMTPSPDGEMQLASVQLEAHGASDWDGRAMLPSEGRWGGYECAATRSAALALALVGLAVSVLDAAPVAEGPEPNAARWRAAEARLLMALREAVDTYEQALVPAASEPEPSFHGVPVEDETKPAVDRSGRLCPGCRDGVGCLFPVTCVQPEAPQERAYGEGGPGDRLGWP